MSVSAALYDTPEVAKVRDISCHHSILLEERQQPYIQDIGKAENGLEPDEHPGISQRLSRPTVDIHSTWEFEGPWDMTLRGGQHIIETPWLMGKAGGLFVISFDDREPGA
jgi:hypothetical protein